MSKKQKRLLRLIFIISLLATLGSLYYGFFGDPVENIKIGDMRNHMNGLSPCQLCRYARIIVYPITVLSAIALIRKEKEIGYYTAVFSFLGLLLETYHYILQKTPIESGYYCTMSNPCDALSVNYLGFITIPLLCRIACFIIFVASIMLIRSHKNYKPSIDLIKGIQQQQ